MKKEMRKPIMLALTIVFVLCIGVYIVGKNVSPNRGGDLEAQTAAAVPGVGEILHMGGYDWRVLDVKDGKVLIITEQIIERRRYNEEFENVTWETCTLRKYLNGEFLQKFTAEEQRRIAETRVQNPNNLWYGINGGNYTTDKIFLLSLEEVDGYFGKSGDYENERRMEYEGEYPDGKWVKADNGHGFSNANDSNRIAKYDGQASWWWLRSPGNFSDNAAIVNGDGGVRVYGSNVRNNRGGVCPALWLNL